jgi:hypothetical protein
LPAARCCYGSARRLITGTVAAPFPGRRSSFPRLLPGPPRLAAGQVPGRRLVPGTSQPLPPFGPPGQCPRGRPRPTPPSSLPICGSVRFAFCAALPASFVPSRLIVPNDTMPSAASSRSSARPAPPRAGPGTGRWWHGRGAAAGDHPVARIPHAPPLDHPAGPLALAVPIQQQRHHHLRVKRRPAVPVGPVPAPEPAQIQGGHRIQHHERQIVLGRHSRMTAGSSNG